MSRRKAKSNFSPLIEWPAVQLRMAAATVEHPVPACTCDASNIETQLSGSQPQLTKVLEESR